MHKISRFFPYLFVHFLLGLIASFAYVFFYAYKRNRSAGIFILMEDS